MLKNTFCHRDSHLKEGPEEDNWRSSSNREYCHEEKNSESENSGSQKRKHLSSVCQTKHKKTNGRQAYSEENDVPAYDYDDEDFSEHSILVHSQDSNCDNSFSFSALDIICSGRASPKECSNISETKVSKNGIALDSLSESGEHLLGKNFREPNSHKFKETPSSIPLPNVCNPDQLVTQNTSSQAASKKSEGQLSSLNVQPYESATLPYPSSTLHTTVHGSWKLHLSPRNENFSSLKDKDGNIKGIVPDSGFSAKALLNGSISSSQVSPVPFTKVVQPQEALKGIYGQYRFARLDDTNPVIEKYKEVSVDRLFYEPSSQMSPVQLVGMQMENGNCFSESTVPLKKTTLEPSTYVRTTYYKNNLPQECLERNKLYINSNLRYCLSNSYDNLSDTDSSISCASSYTYSPPKIHKRYSFPLTTECSVPKEKLFVGRKYQRSPLSYSLEKMFPVNMTEKVIDTHCHLDFLFQRENHKGTFMAYKDKNVNDFLPCFEGCISNFIEPYFFTKRSNWEDLLKEENVWASFGVHPHHCYRYDEAVEEIMLQALKHEKVVAFGEIGLDYSTRNSCNKALQQQIFKRQLTIAVKHCLPLIIHCRDAQEDCLRILTEMVPRETKIHRHCFTGNWNEAKEWLDKFPNLYLGFTSLVTFRTVGELHEVVRQTPVNRLLFETDAPYFLPSQVADGTNDSGSKERKFSHPGMVVHVAAQIATLKGITDFPGFLATVRENTKNMYNI